MTRIVPTSAVLARFREDYDHLLAEDPNNNVGRMCDLLDEPRTHTEREWLLIQYMTSKTNCSYRVLNVLTGAQRICSTDNMINLY